MHIKSETLRVYEDNQFLCEVFYDGQKTLLFGDSGKPLRDELKSTDEEYEEILKDIKHLLIEEEHLYMLDVEQSEFSREFRKKYYNRDSVLIN